MQMQAPAVSTAISARANHSLVWTEKARRFLLVGSDAGEFAEPLAPEHERRGAAECKQHEQQHFT